MTHFLRLDPIPDESTFPIYRDQCFPTTEIPSAPIRAQSWSNEQEIATATKDGIEIIHLDSNVFKNHSKIESIQIPFITESLFNQDHECQDCFTLTTYYVVIHDCTN